VVFAAAEAGAEFVLEIDLPAAPLQRSFFQLVPPKDAPFTASTNGAAIRGEPNETIRFPIQLALAQPEMDFERQTLMLRLALDGETADVPLEVRRLGAIRPLLDGQRGDEAEHLAGRLAPPEGKRASAEASLFGAYKTDALRLALRVDDDRTTPFSIDAAGATRGDEWTVGVGLDGTAEHLEFRILDDADGPRVEPIFGVSPPRVRAVRIERLVAGANAGKAGGAAPGASERRHYLLTIPASALDVRGLNPPARVRLAARYADDDADGLPATELRWGRGLDGTRSTTEFRRLQLSK
jgi:hypothetical protein